MEAADGQEQPGRLMPKVVYLKINLDYEEQTVTVFSNLWAGGFRGWKSLIP